jgi:peptidyl-tRNA hydrolase
MKKVFDTSCEVTKKKPVRDINAEPEMQELKRMIREGELDPRRLKDAGNRVELDAPEETRS